MEELALCFHHSAIHGGHTDDFPLRSTRLAQRRVLAFITASSFDRFGFLISSNNLTASELAPHITITGVKHPAVLHRHPYKECAEENSERDLRDTAEEIFMSIIHSACLTQVSRPIRDAFHASSSARGSRARHPSRTLPESQPRLDCHSECLQEMSGDHEISHFLPRGLRRRKGMVNGVHSRNELLVSCLGHVLQPREELYSRRLMNFALGMNFFPKK